MKKVFSISLSLLILVAMVHISVAAHYCGGSLATSKISLSGKPGSCGMEDSKKDLPLACTQFAAHCCIDIVAYFGINDNYFPSSTYVPGVYQNTFQVFDYPVCPILHSLVSIKSMYTSVGPPDTPVSNVDQSDICVFRI